MKGGAEKGSTAFELLRKLAGTSREVAAEASWRGGTVLCRVQGALSATSDTIKVSGWGLLTFDVNSVDISSCKFDERLSTNPLPREAKTDLDTGIPFASLHLDDGTRITFSRIPT